MDLIPLSALALGDCGCLNLLRVQVAYYPMRVRRKTKSDRNYGNVRNFIKIIGADDSPLFVGVSELRLFRFWKQESRIDVFNMDLHPILMFKNSGSRREYLMSLRFMADQDFAP